MANKTFKTGQDLRARSIGDADCIFTGKVISRTAKTVTIQVGDTPPYVVGGARVKDGAKRCKIHLTGDDKHEFCYPFGQYSMAPVFRA